MLLQEEDKVLAFRKGSLVSVFNLHPTRSYAAYYLPVKKAGDYSVVFNSDDAAFGGFGRVDENAVYRAEKDKGGSTGFLTYIPNRTAIVFRKK